MIQLLGILLCLSGVSILVVLVLVRRGRLPPALLDSLGSRGPMLTMAAGFGLAGVGALLGSGILLPSLPSGRPPRNPFAARNNGRLPKVAPEGPANQSGEIPPGTPPEEAFEQLKARYGENRVLRLVVIDPEKTLKLDAVKSTLAMLPRDPFSRSVYIAPTERGMVGAAAPVVRTASHALQFAQFGSAGVDLSPAAPNRPVTVTVVVPPRRPLEIPADIAPREAFKRVAGRYGDWQTLRLIVKDPENSADIDTIRQMLARACGGSDKASIYLRQSSDMVVGVAAPMTRINETALPGIFAPLGRTDGRRDPQTDVLTLTVAVRVRSPQEKRRIARQKAKEENRKAMATLDALRPKSFGGLTHDQAVKGITPYLSSSDKLLRSAAVGALGSWKDPFDIPTLATMVDDPDYEVRVVAMAALGLMQDKRSVAALVRCLDRRHGEHAVIHGRDIQFVDDDGMAAEHYLVNMGPYCEAEVIGFLREGGHKMMGRCHACYVLRMVGTRASLAVLKAIKHESSLARGEAKMAWIEIASRIGLKSSDPEYDVDR